jgi:hypothetical protein
MPVSTPGVFRANGEIQDEYSINVKLTVIYFRVFLERAVWFLLR